MLRQTEILLLLLVVSVALQFLLRPLRWRRFGFAFLAVLALWIGVHGLHFVFLQVRARGGSASAQLALSRWYVNQFRSFGYCSWDASERWLKAAAKQQHPEALFLLGDMHANGFRVPFDSETGQTEKAVARSLGFDYPGNSYFVERFVLSREEPIFLGKVAAAGHRLWSMMR